jgi:crotonobetainyl-CoA:carnitine CoA-transferase CaiB-like acyl-CoA transferase
VAEAMADAQVRARDMLLHVDVPGHGAFRVLGNPVKMSALAALVPSAPPGLGQHTDEVLQSLGYSQDDIDLITQAGATALSPQ